MDPSEAIEDLFAADSAKRIAAAEWFARQSELDPKATMAVLQALADPHEQVREWATAAVESLDHPNPSLTREFAARLGDPSDDVAYWAATLLGRIGSEARAVCDDLISRLNDDQTSLNVRERAVWAIGKIGAPPHCADALTRAAQSEHKRLATLARRAMEQ